MASQGEVVGGNSALRDSGPRYAASNNWPDYPPVLTRLKGMDVTQRLNEKGHYVAEWGPKNGQKVVVFESTRPLTGADFREGGKALKKLRDAAK